MQAQLISFSLGLLDQKTLQNDDTTKEEKKIKWLCSILTNSKSGKVQLQWTIKLQKKSMEQITVCICFSSNYGSRHVTSEEAKIILRLQFNL